LLFDVTDLASLMYYEIRSNIILLKIGAGLFERTSSVGKLKERERQKWTKWSRSMCKAQTKLFPFSCYTM